MTHPCGQDNKICISVEVPNGIHKVLLLGWARAGTGMLPPDSMYQHVNIKTIDLLLFSINNTLTSVCTYMFLLENLKPKFFNSSIEANTSGGLQTNVQKGELRHPTEGTEIFSQVVAMQIPGRE